MFCLEDFNFYGWRGANSVVTQQVPTINNQANDYELLVTDNGKVIVLAKVTNAVLTIPAGLPVGFNCLVVQGDSGQIVITPDGTTLNSDDGNLITRVEFSTASIVSIAQDIFIISGDLTT